MLNKYEGLNLPIVQACQNAANSVPVIDLKFAAEQFGNYQQADTFDHVVLPAHLHASEGYFLARVEGDSMNKRIPPGAWCLFHFNPQGTRNGKLYWYNTAAFQTLNWVGNTPLNAITDCP